MREGLLWFDDDPDRELLQKVALAVIAYRRKFKEMPNICCVHLSELKEKQQIGTVEVVPWPTVLKHHFWVGQEVKR